MLIDIYNKFKATGIGGGDKGTDHSYIDHYYSDKFSNLRNQHLNILEIGIHRGYSLNMWREYFPNANITGVDIKKVDVECKGCNLIFGDATNQKTFYGIDHLDIVIDDGSHKLKHQLKTFDILFPKLRSGGVYIIEDIFDLDKTESIFLDLPGQVQIYDFRKIKNRWDDVIVEITKK